MDLRYAIRQITRYPRFTFVAVLTLALGIGATAAVFAVVDAVYLKPLAFQEPDRIVTVRLRTVEGGSWGVGAGTMLAVEALPAVAYVAGSVGTSHTLLGGVLPHAVRGEAVTADYFAVFGVEAAIGRVLGRADESGAPAVVLSDSLWRRAFGGAPDIVGATVHLDDVSHVVVGVMPRDYPSLEGSEFWVLLKLRPGELTQVGRGPIEAVARLRGDDLAAARQQAATLSGTMAPIDGELPQVALMPIAEAWRSISPSTLWTLLGAVSLVLLIACANVASLLLTKGRARSTELAVREALGATRLRLVRQLLTESFLLAAVAAGAGVALAWVLLRLLFAGAVPDVARLSETNVDWRVVLFAAAAGAGSVILFGLMPSVAAAWRPRRIAEAGRMTTVQGRRASQVLIGVEVAVTMALLVGSGTMLARLHALLTIETGFDPKELHVATIRPTGIGYTETSRFYEQVVAELRLAGLDAGAISRMPVHRLIASPVEIQASDGAARTARKRVASASTLSLLGVSILRGRDITLLDSPGGDRVGVINESLAKQLGDAEDPLGAVITVVTDGKSHRVRIVGISQDFRDSYFRPTRPELYLSVAQFPSFSMHLVVRSDRPPDSIQAALQRAVHQVDPRQALFEQSTAEALVVTHTAYGRFMTTLISLFGSLAVLLVVSGMGSVVAASISERTREIGIRMALGAASRDLAALLLREIVPPVLVGVALGLVATYNLSHLLQRLMTGIQGFDPQIYGVMALGLLAIAAFAAWLPLRAAYRIDPAVVLRSE